MTPTDETPDRQPDPSPRPPDRFAFAAALAVAAALVLIGHQPPEAMAAELGAAATVYGVYRRS
ncbi:MAG: hypothetical protein AUG49_18930 [Catenulispora sp. 13_1_20CM_3_70_7]|nr:MAG: hypothetical protein AUG49_18930 [Catenulispora sp. 13_1_20CM_3_70_7]